jgi:hypothetical protein
LTKGENDDIMKKRSSKRGTIMLTSGKKRFFAMIIVILLLAMSFTSCGFEEETQMAKEVCTNFLDGVLKDDFLMAYSSFDDIISGSDFAEFWDYVCDIMENSKSYEIEELGWEFTNYEGVDLFASSFEVVTDDGKVIQFIVYIDGEGLYGINAYDSTPFVESTKWVSVVNVVMTVISLVLCVVTIWMIIDVAKRKIRNKVLWILLVLFGFWFEAAIGFEAGYFDFNFGISLLFKSAKAYTINSAEAIGARIAIPIGTIIYFFLRKTLSEQDKIADERIIAAREAAEAEARAAAEAEAKAKAEAEQAALEEAAVEAESAEEKTEENNEDQ